MVLGASFLWYQSFQLLYTLFIQEPSLSILESLFVGFLLNLFLTGAIALPGFVFPTHKLLPQSFYSIQNSKRLEFWNKTIGLKYFKIVLMAFFWGSKKNRKRYFNGTRSGILNFVYQTKQSEFGHLASLLLIQSTSIMVFILGYSYVFVFATIINFIGNGYPILLQREHRYRLSRFIPKHTTTQ